MIAQNYILIVFYIYEYCFIVLFHLTGVSVLKSSYISKDNVL